MMCENKEFAMDKQELADDMLEQVSGGTGVEEEEEEVPTYVDEWAAYEAIHCEGKEYTILEGE